jgi:hypothetical protein
MKNLLILFILVSNILLGSDGFIENKGQIVNQYNVSASEILFIHEAEDFRVLLTEKGFSYEIIVNDLNGDKKDLIANSIHENSKVNYNFHRIDFIFPHEKFEIEKSNPVPCQLNYITNGLTISTKSFKRVLYKNILPGLHIEFLIDEENKFKYNVISEEKNDFSDFLINIEGANSLSITQDKKLKIETNFGEILEDIPYSYIELENGRKKEIEILFILEENRLKFSGDSSLRNKYLVIDPEPYVEWSSYFGGGGLDWGMDIAADENGNSYQTGLTTSMTAIATTGAFQGSFSGDIDGFLTKFDEDGNLEWATYFGGDQTDRTYGITTDENGNIYVAGSTFSENNIATAGVLQPFIFGIDDMFIMKFDSDGQRLWGTYYGGEAHDFPVAICHANNNLFITGHTTSTNNIATTGSFLPNINATEAGFLVNISDNGSALNWGSYIGSNGNTSGEGIDILSDGRIVIAGRTTAQSDIASIGAHQDAFIGFVQGFLIVFNSNGIRDWGTYYGGDFSNRADDVAVLDDYIYLVGNSNSNNNIATANAYQTTKVDEHGFLAKFNDQGVREWGTYVGGNMEDIIKSVTAKNRMIIVGGHTRSTINIASVGAHQETQVQNFDGFFNAFNPSGDYLWGTYFGGEGDENINGVAYLNSNAIVFSGKTSGSQGEVTFGNSYQSTYGGGNDDALTGKIFIPCKEILVGNNFSLCEGDEDTLIASGVGDISWYVNNDLFGANDTILVSPITTTIYEAILTDYSNCSDTQTVMVTVNPVDDPSFTFFNFCVDASNGPTNIITPNGTFSFDPEPGDGATIDENTGTISDGVLFTTYNIKYLTTGICPDSVILEVTVLETNDPSFDYLNLCENESIVPSNIATAGGVFSFANPPSNNETIDANTGEIFNAIAGESYEVTHTTPAGDCQTIQTEQIVILEAPTVTAGEDLERCIYHDSLLLVGVPSGGTFTGNGIVTNYFHPDDAGLGNHIVIYDYTSSNGCSNNDSINIVVDECLSIEEFSKEFINLYPNPANSSVYLFSNNTINEVIIIDNLGKTVLTEKSLNKTNLKLDISMLNKGSYVVIIHTDNFNHTKKLIIN